MTEDAHSDAALAAATRREIERVRGKGGLGESGRLRELFDFLVERSGDRTPPKEVEIAVAVFGKTESETLKDDPVARVYVHRLRKRLDEFYRRAGAPEGVRLDVPKGQYRITGRRIGAETAETAPDAARRAPLAWFTGKRGAGVAAAMVLLLAANIAVLALIAQTARREAPVHPVWAQFSDPARPAIIALGDYYMFGDYGDGPFLRRLVRDFSINSREELLRRRLEDREAFDRYTDVNLQYLPISAGFALAEIMPGAPRGKPVRAVLASDLTADTIRGNDIIYIGLLSGLSMLRDPVFAQSRFSIGGSYDEIADTVSGESYVSEAFVAESYAGMYRDYGLFSSFEGPDGARIVVIAGARDTAATGIAERLSRPGVLDALREAVGGASSFEALFEIEGQQNVSMDIRLAAAGALDSARIWTAQPPRAFPGE